MECMHVWGVYSNILDICGRCGDFKTVKKRKEMRIKVQRISDNNESTISAVYIDGMFFCWGLEDEHRTTKVFGDTRIPNGIYHVDLRTVGGHHQRYSKKFPDFHKGMLHVMNVPNFEYILIHIGNDDDDTAGCLLLGDTANNNTIGNGFIGSSTNAYKRFYKHIIQAFQRDEDVTIQYI